MRRIRRLVRGALLVWGVVGLAFAAPSAPDPALQAGKADGPTELLLKLETALTTGAPKDFLSLSTLDPARDEVRAFVSQWVVAGTTRAAIHERDRQTLPGGGIRLAVEVLVEAGKNGRLATWTLDTEPRDTGWLVTRAVTVRYLSTGSIVSSWIPRCSNHAHNLVIQAEDFELHLPTGDVFVATAAGAVTAAVLLGKGEMVFKPATATERRQVQLYCGREEFRTPFTWAYVRMPPGESASRLPAAQLTRMTVASRDLERAREVLTEQSPKSFGLELADLSRVPWSLAPSGGEFLADIAAPKYGTLTYANSNRDPEDISLFDRGHHRTISTYMSASRRSTRPRSYDEDDDAEYDVLDYSVDNSFAPDRFWMEGSTRLTIKIRAFAVSAISLRLAESLVVQSVSSDKHGRLLALHVRGQNSMVVNLPSPAHRDDMLVLTVKYAGRLEPQGVDRENIAVDQSVSRNNDVLEVAQPEPNFVYSNRSAWYAQATTSDYATATIRMTVPAAFTAACSGEPASGSPVLIRATSDDAPARKLHVFVATAPVRYLGCVISRFVQGEPVTIALPASSLTASAAPADAGRSLPVRVFSTVRQRGRAREVAARAGEIAAFYASLIHDMPYPSLNVAVVESNVPGGHAPGYLAILNQPLPTTPFVWRDDPAAFDDYPDFFVAHEVAHQWWGQAVGWKNYHEQWLSEGMAQYFAVLFAEHQRGPQVFAALLRQLARWADDDSDQGPVYLGYRLGYTKGAGRTFRALVYNKGAIALHMLRRMMGDDAFFRALRRFYAEHRFEKAGTDDLQRAFEAESGSTLTTFFDEWIVGQDLPALTSAWTVAPDGSAVTVKLTQAPGHIFEFPVTVSLAYVNGTVEDQMVIVRAAETTASWPIKGRLARVLVNRDRLTPLSH